MFPTSNFDVFSRNPAVFRQKTMEGMEKARQDKTPRGFFKPRGVESILQAVEKL